MHIEPLKVNFSYLPGDWVPRRSLLCLKSEISLFLFPSCDLSSVKERNSWRGLVSSHHIFIPLNCSVQAMCTQNNLGTAAAWCEKKWCGGSCMQSCLSLSRHFCFFLLFSDRFSSFTFKPSTESVYHLPAVMKSLSKRSRWKVRQVSKA